MLSPAKPPPLGSNSLQDYHHKQKLERMDTLRPDAQLFNRERITLGAECLLSPGEKSQLAGWPGGTAAATEEAPGEDRREYKLM